MQPHLTRTRVALTVAGLLLAAAPTAYAGLAEADSAVPERKAPERKAPERNAPERNAPERNAPERGAPCIETQLFFGTERPDGGPAVTDAQFMAFVDSEVTPEFPDGLTVQSGRGQWRDVSGAIEKERSYELILLYPVARAAVSDRRIEGIRQAYEKEFGQEAVARVDERARVDF
ncbi:DUF3574 domain-containing protein [Streptomyces griseorubiginosus]|uniref:DUF3574 domain-containing protein n=1 Tax=Streptomyces griseorubiginosus TaxID=67304 RepID=UPI002E7FDC1E|nr:DUF3574 domain-containing protein [Streptomyces griseorubiginosus]WUB48202.1 DUF3574 domain-containing protein [Streptomyces griseorubiginosus]WUB56727.1 DUF3574 domain-containing protein [Streptomyces griseorubiginosus]